jgi:drug/metabolite transporter (DMT)-like permease
MIRNVRVRRVVAACTAAGGVALLLLAPRNATWLGILLIVAGLALELIGMNLRHRDR